MEQRARGDMQVAVLFNRPELPPDHPEAESERWVATAVEDVTRLLSVAGFDVRPIGACHDIGAIQSQLSACRPDVVFNLFEGLADRPASEIAVARMLERLRLPFTGCPSRSLRLCLNKPLAKQQLRAAGLPTPWHRVVRDLPVDCGEIPWPVIVKPARRDASEGIDQDSVATTPAALTARVKKLLKDYGPLVLIEQFLAGREFTMGLIEHPALTSLPLAEVNFTPCRAAPWPILSYAAKWQPGTPDYDATVMRNAVPLPAVTSRMLLYLATQAFRVLGCRDYARIDMRMTKSGEPMILEVNPNPDMSPTACFAGALAAAGIDRASFLVGLVLQAAGRKRIGPTAQRQAAHSCR